MSPSLKGGVTTIGNFDATHRGHRHLLKVAAQLCKNKQPHVPLTIITFVPHPRTILLATTPPLLIASRWQKYQQLAACGVDGVIEITFDHNFSQLSPHDFIRDVILPLDPKALVIGQGFRFGNHRAGNVETLRAQGWNVTEVPPLQDLINGTIQTISSTAIRTALSQSDIDGANRLLGYPYNICGSVTSGDQLGTAIGWPTLNIDIDNNQCLPRKGVYAAFVRPLTDPEKPLVGKPLTKVLDTPLNNSQGWFPGALYIGDRPGLKDIALTPKTRVEVHIITDKEDPPPPDPPTPFMMQSSQWKNRERSMGVDFSSPHWIVVPRAYIREDKVLGLDQLGEQIKSDVYNIRALLNG